MKNILMVGNYANDTGYAWNNIYRLFDTIAEHFAPKGIKVFASFAEIRNDFSPFLNIDSPFLLFKPKDYSYDNIRGLLSFIHKYNISIVYFTDQNTFSPLYLILKIFGVKAILVHCRVSVPDPKPATPSPAPRKQLKYILNRLPLLTADITFAVSQFVYDRLALKNQYPPHKLVRVINGIDIDKFKPLSPNQIYEKEQLHIFISGRATPHKGIDILIKSIHRILQENNTVSFVIDYAGDGPHMEAYKKLAEELSVSQYIRFHGQVPSTHLLLQQSDIVCVPSAWGDACPSAVSEALASGKPLITTNAGGIPEMVGARQNAIIIEPGDIDALAKNLTLLINNPRLRQEYAQAARKHAVDALSQERYYHEMLYHFDEIASKYLEIDN